ncbi:MAG: RNA-binding S4 domain-containing protein [Alphaproteobacteria bacterium]|nr:RNA-binding S4 domain-containing protein [Alphaproteobacteria bacterium]
MRLDKFLFFTRLTKTRSLAQKIVGEGHVRMDGQPVTRAHAEVRPGSVITLPLHGAVHVIRVEALPARRGPASEARSHYTALTPAQPIDAAVAAF